jgi:hypothetical protein
MITANTVGGRAANTAGGRAAIAVVCTLLLAAVAGCNQVSPGAGQSATSQTDTISPVSAQSPSISGTPPAQAMVGMVYSFQPSTGDSSGQTLTFSVKALPSWATFDTTTGRLSGTPSASDIGTYAGILISVSDGSETASLPAFTISVAAEAPPTPATISISGSPATRATVGTAYRFQPSASDAAGYALTFAITGKPSWATFNVTTGQLSGTPVAADVGTYGGIVISVSDSQGRASLQSFSITVAGAATSSATRISGTPRTTVVARKAYSFRPSASGPDGATLSFSVKNLPSWATFSIATGQLSGTPTTAGSYPGIVISVSDGQTTASLAPFTITVSSSTGSATVTWAAPTENTNGTPLTDLSGFTISYGTSATALTQTVAVGSASASSYTIANLAAGTWYFSIKANASNGSESAPSAVLSATID